MPVRGWVMYSIRKVPLLLMVGVAALAADAAEMQKDAADPIRFAQQTVAIGNHVVKLEVANTDKLRQQGLMYRKELPREAGMVFVFPDSRKYCMWMKNTLLPLSVAFVDERGVILNIADMVPLTETVHCSTGEAKWAIEMNLGWYARNGIIPGQKIDSITTLYSNE